MSSQMSGVIQPGGTEVHSNKPGETGSLGRAKRHSNMQSGNKVLFFLFQTKTFEWRLGGIERDVKTIVIFHDAECGDEKTSC